MDESDRLLPIANVGRIMKNILPPNAKISKGSKETMQECVSEFISFVTGEASDKCHKENRKTVNGDDICWALSTLGFDNYGEVITRYLHKYREFEREKSNKDGECNSSGNEENRDHYESLTSFRNLVETSTSLPLEFRIIDSNKGKASS
ncbi:hypothetical protein RND81_09G227900 [Saponaria officinalis]|uniref:Transcription factor CBF/NF-Y/archaeal histone domain-containing protein n=1 Tax=Saponaria officinalis TaxID=3572 RepID=A0AAW1IQI2_SAPOF